MKKKPGRAIATGLLLHMAYACSAQSNWNNAYLYLNDDVSGDTLVRITKKN